MPAGFFVGSSQRSQQPLPEAGEEGLVVLPAPPDDLAARIVGHIPYREGTQRILEPSAGTGVTASIVIPADLLVDATPSGLEGGPQPHG